MITIHSNYISPDSFEPEVKTVSAAYSAHMDSVVIDIDGKSIDLTRNDANTFAHGLLAEIEKTKDSEEARIQDMLGAVVMELLKAHPGLAVEYTAAPYGKTATDKIFEIKSMLVNDSRESIREVLEDSVRKNRSTPVVPGTVLVIHGIYGPMASSMSSNQGMIGEAKVVSGPPLKVGELPSALWSRCKIRFAVV